MNNALKITFCSAMALSLAACHATAMSAADKTEVKITADSSRANEVWVINTFTIKAGEKAESVANLQLELVEKVKKPWKGFISQQTLVSQDGKTVSTVEAYTDFDSLKAIAQDARLVEYRQRILQHATMNPVVYKIAGETK